MTLLESLFSSSTTLGVVPVLIGPLQALLAILPGLLVMMGGLLLAMFKPSTAKKLIRLMWAQKAAVLGIVVVAVGGYYGVQHLRGSVTGSTQEAEQADFDWPMFRGGPERLGAAPGSASPVEGDLNWAFDNVDQTFYSTPAVVANRIYATSAEKTLFKDRGAIYCLDADTGGVVWKCEPDGFRATFSSPAVSKDFLVVGEGLHFTTDARIFCLDISEQGKGKVLWEYRTHSHVESSACIADGHVYIGAGDDGYYCFKLAPDASGNPQMVWHVEGDAYPDAETSPVVVDGKVYVGLGLGGRAICCLDAKDGTELWRVETPYPVFTPASYRDGKLYVGMGNGNFIQNAEQARTAELDKLRKKGASEEELAAARETLGPAGEVWCIDTETHEVAWKYKAGRVILGAVAAGEDAIFFGSRDGNLYCLTPAGKEIGKWNAHAAIVACPALTDACVYVATESGQVYGLDRNTLELVWEATIGTAPPFLSSPTVARGHVYIGSQANGLVSLGKPSSVKRKIVWAGRLAGPGKGGALQPPVLSKRGRLLWRYPDGDDPLAVAGPVAVLDEVLYVPVADGEEKGMVCLGTSVGPRQAPPVLWSVKTPKGVHRSPACDEDHVLFVDGVEGDPNRKLTCVAAETGKTEWAHDVTTDATGVVFLNRDRVFLQSPADTLTCLDLNGEVQWQQPIGKTSFSPDAQQDFVVVATQQPATLQLLDRAAGVVLWKQDVAATPTTGPVIQGREIYLGTDEAVEARHLIDGTIRWRSETGSVATDLAIGREWLATINGDSKLIFVDLEDGALVGKPQDALANVPPLLARGSVLYQSKRGLVQYGPSDQGGPAPWMKVSWMGDLTAPMVTSGSRVYFATQKKGLICAGGPKQ